MPTTGEKKALWFFAIVALSGSGVRLLRSADSPLASADTAALGAQLARVDSVRAHQRTGRRRGKPATQATRATAARPRAADNPAPVLVDLDRATTDEIDALPGIGPVLAGRIVAYRDSAGAFGRLEALCEVSGIGPALVKRLRPLVTFTGPQRPLSDECGGASRKPRAPRRSRGPGLR